ncbi:Y-family DNA polymerase [Flavobacterium sp. NRK F10]|uniref:Y-family DNA polymerase n=1 Tax=Flavobacterium sp. NRK F10 TaxID=2954931 RepID=UPI0020913951|nr:Y-family DNA polymerase [Flavobacterium sp. NRK F10]MCO6175063.1 Y-family DNA polymerase [Flavobacterium sp. NRK F10]
MFALVDCNNFYASCERIFQPQYQNQPIVVLSNNDGCIISRSEEAKRLGIPMAAPEFKFKKLLAEHNVKVFSSNYPLYGDMSSRVMNLLHHFTPDVEVYSIDEAFLNFKTVKIDHYYSYGQDIKNYIKKCLSLPVCVGIAPTKTLAKAANRIAKKFPERTNGVHVIDSEEKRLKTLKWMAIEDVWGIGFRLSKKFRAKNIKTAYDFTLPEHENTIKTLMGITGLRLKMELEGTPAIESNDSNEKKSIAITRSFEHSISDLKELKERITTFASVCAEKLRKQNTLCNGIILYLRKDSYDPKNTRYNYTSFYTLPFASNSTLTINTIALKMLNDLYEEGSVYKKAGVIVTQIVKSEEVQLSIFENENPKHQHLMHTIDTCNKKWGRKIRLGSQDLKRTWKMKQNHLSNQYTTKINEILTVKC